jgi:Ca2+-binding EF-hand superfamily protein
MLYRVHLACEGFELTQLVELLGENLTDDDIEAMIREADKDGDGKISFKGISDCFSNAELS